MRWETLRKLSAVVNRFLFCFVRWPKLGPLVPNFGHPMFYPDKAFPATIWKCEPNFGHFESFKKTQRNEETK